MENGMNILQPQVSIVNEFDGQKLKIANPSWDDNSVFPFLKVTEEERKNTSKASKMQCPKHQIRAWVFAKCEPALLEKPLVWLDD